MDWSAVWEWWLVYGFQGIAGGVLGGLVTGGAVWLTLRHERMLRSDELARADLLEQRRVVGRILEKAIDLDATLADGMKTDVDVRAALVLLGRELRLSLPMVASLSGGLGTTLQKAVGAIHVLTGRPTLSFDQTGRLASSVMRRCTWWLSAPNTYDDAQDDRAEKRARGTTAMEDVMFTPYDELWKRDTSDPDGPPIH